MLILGVWLHVTGYTLTFLASSPDICTVAGMSTSPICLHFSKQLKFTPSMLYVTQISETLPPVQSTVSWLMVRGWQSSSPVKQTSLLMQEVLGVKKQQLLMQSWLSMRSTKLDWMLSLRYLRDLRLEIFLKRRQSQQKNSNLVAGHPAKLRTTSLMALAYTPVKQMVVRSLPEASLLKDLSILMQLTPSTEYSRQKEVIQNPSNPSSWMAQKVTGSPSEMMQPMYSPSLLFSALQPFPYSELSWETSLQSVQLVLQKELQKTVPSLLKGDKLSMLYFDLVISMGVISKSYLSSSPSSFSSGFFSLKHSAARSSQFFLHLMQSLPLQETQPGLQGKQMNSYRKNLRVHCTHTPLLYSSQLGSLSSHWKNLFRKYLSLQARHLPYSALLMQLSSAFSHQPLLISMYPESQTSQSPSSLYLKQLGSSFTQQRPSLMWQPGVHLVQALSLTVTQWGISQQPLLLIWKGDLHLVHPFPEVSIHPSILHFLASWLYSKGCSQYVHSPLTQMHPGSTGRHTPSLETQQPSLHLLHPPFLLQLMQNLSSLMQRPSKITQPLMQVVHLPL